MGMDKMDVRLEGLSFKADGSQTALCINVLTTLLSLTGELSNYVTLMSRSFDCTYGCRISCSW